MEHFNEPHSSVNEPTPTQPNVGNNFGSAIGKSFFILIIQIFVMPIKVLKTAVDQVVLCYPLGLLAIIITALDMPYGAGSFFVGAIIGLYFLPIALGLYKEFIALMIVTVRKLEEIARNTRK